MTIVQPGIRRRQEVQYGAANQLLHCWPDLDGETVDPDAGATCSIYRPGQTTPETTGACSETADLQLVYALNASDTSRYTLRQDYVAEFTFTVSNVTRTVRRQFDVVRVPLVRFPPLRVADLKNAHKSVDAALAQLSITDAHQRFILPAWEDVLQHVEGSGWRPALLTDPEALVPMLRARALQKMARAMRSAPNDVWSKLADEFEKDYADAKGNTVLRYSPTDEHAQSEEHRNWTQPSLIIGPDFTSTSSSGTIGYPSAYKRVWP